MENFVVLKRNVKRNISYSFMVITGILLSILSFIFDLSEFKIWNKDVDIDQSTLLTVMAIAYLCGFLILFLLPKLNNRIIEICLILGAFFFLAMLLPFNLLYTKIVFYLLIFTFGTFVPLFLFLIISKFSISSGFFYSLLSIFSGGLVTFILSLDFIKNNFVILCVLGFLISLIVCFIIYKTFSLNNDFICVTEKYRIQRIFSLDEKLNNPILKKEKRHILPIKLTLGISLLVFISTIVLSLISEIFKSQNLDSSFYYLFASIGALIFILLFKKLNSNFMLFVYISLVLLIVGLCFLYTANGVLLFLGVAICGTFSCFLNLNVFYSIVLFEEYSSKNIIFFIVLVEYLSNLFIDEVFKRFASINLVTIAIVFTCLLIVVMILFVKYIFAIWNLSINGDVYKKYCDDILKFKDCEVNVNNIFSKNKSKTKNMNEDNVIKNNTKINEINLNESDKKIPNAENKENNIDMNNKINYFKTKENFNELYSKFETLTLTEMLIFELLISGYSLNQIAEILYIRVDSIQKYIANILNKIGRDAFIRMNKRK